jgi:hypothetical protein
MIMVVAKCEGSPSLKSIPAVIGSLFLMFADAMSSYARQTCQSLIQGRRPKRCFMTNRLGWMSALVVLLVSLVVAGNASGQAITTRSTAGTYSVICDGYLTFPNPFPPNSNPPSFQFAPAKALGTATADYSGHFTGTTQLSVGGFAVVTQTVTGTEVLNPNGTGTITYATTIDGNPGPPLNITFVVSENGDRFDGLSTDPGTVFACVLRRISKDDQQARLLKLQPSLHHAPARQAETAKSAGAQLVLVAARAAKKPSPLTSIQ